MRYKLHPEAIQLLPRMLNLLDLTNFEIHSIIIKKSNIFSNLEIFISFLYPHTHILSIYNQNKNTNIRKYIYNNYMDPSKSVLKFKKFSYYEDRYLRKLREPHCVVEPLINLCGGCTHHNYSRLFRDIQTNYQPTL